MLHQKIAHIPHVYTPWFRMVLAQLYPPPYNAGTIEGYCHLLFYRWVTKIEVEVSTFFTSFRGAGFGLGQRLYE